MPLPKWRKKEHTAVEETLAAIAEIDNGADARAVDGEEELHGPIHQMALKKALLGCDSIHTVTNG